MNPSLFFLPVICNRPGFLDIDSKVGAAQLAHAAGDAFFGGFGKDPAVFIHGQHLFGAEGDTDTATFTPVGKYRNFGVLFRG